MLRRIRNAFLLGLGVLTLVAMLGARPALAGGVVGNGTAASCTEAALDAALSGGGLIKFNCGAAVKVIIFTSAKIINADTTIDGDSKIQLRAPGTFHFWINAGRTLTLKRLTVADANPGDGGAIYNAGVLNTNKVTFLKNWGGAIGNYGGTLNLTKTTFQANGATLHGGALYIYSGSVNIKKSMFINNAATQDGGAIYQKGGIVNIVSSTLYANTATAGGGGGAIWTDGVLTISKTTLNANHSGGWGGAIYVGSQANVQLNASTLFNNTASTVGGALDIVGGNVQLTNVTISGNRVTGNFPGGGIMMDSGSVDARFVTFANNQSSQAGSALFIQMGTFQAINTLFSKKGAVNCSGYDAVISLGYNLSTDSSCDLNAATDQKNVNAKLAPLGKNGGPTLTHMLKAGSPALNKGTPVNGVTADQRGQARPKGTHPDIGAVEAQ